MSNVFAVADQAIVDPITIFPDACTGCNLCLHVCPVDLFLPNSQIGGPPLVLYPGECWYEGSCVDVCPEPGAIVLNRPPAMRVNWKPREECRPRDGGSQAAGALPLSSPRASRETHCHKRER